MSSGNVWCNGLVLDTIGCVVVVMSGVMVWYWIPSDCVGCVAVVHLGKYLALTGSCGPALPAAAARYDLIFISLRSSDSNKGVMRSSI